LIAVVALFRHRHDYVESLKKRVGTVMRGAPRCISREKGTGS
jgi:hypothetical protein